MSEKSIDLKCPLCGKLLLATSVQIGQKVRCPKCKFQFVLRDPDEEETQVMLDDDDEEPEKV